MTKFNRFFISLLVTGLLAVAYTPISQAESYGDKVGKKALNGFVNITTGALEIPKNMINTSNKSNIFFGIVGGLFKGLLHTGGRIGTGIADLVTFPLPTKPIAYPLYIWDDFDVDTTYGEAFRLDENHSNIEIPVVQPVAVRARVAPKAAAVGRTNQYNPQTNRKLDAIFKKQMIK